jgi:hypothetical protein
VIVRRVLRKFKIMSTKKMTAANPAAPAALTAAIFQAWREIPAAGFVFMNSELSPCGLQSVPQFYGLAQRSHTVTIQPARTCAIASSGDIAIASSGDAPGNTNRDF